MKIREFLEENKDKYTCIDYECGNVTYDTINGFTSDNTKEEKEKAMSENIDLFSFCKMNVFEYVNWLDSMEEDPEDEEEKERILAVAKNKYGYDANDTFLVISK